MYIHTYINSAVFEIIFISIEESKWAFVDKDICNNEIFDN